MTILIWGLRFNGLWLPFLSLAVAFLAKKVDREVKPSTGSSIALWLTIACILTYTFGYFVMDSGASVSYRLVFSIMTVVFTLYTILVCVRAKDVMDFDKYG